MSSSLVRGLMAVAALTGLATASVGAQQGAGTRVTGRVTDKDGGLPIDGAQVRVDGSTIGTIPVRTDGSPCCDCSRATTSCAWCASGTCPT